jgi:hypothetical protein
MIISEKLTCTLRNGRFVTYVNLDTVDENFGTVRNYAQMSSDFCKKHERTFWCNYTGCLDSIHQTDRPLKEVNDLKSVRKQLTRNEDEPDRTPNRRGA